METVYCSGDEPLAVALKIKFFEDPKGVKVETEISFVESRVKDKWAVVVNERQLSLDDVLNRAAEKIVADEIMARAADETMKAIHGLNVTVERSVN